MSRHRERSQTTNGTRFTRGTWYFNGAYYNNAPFWNYTGVCTELNGCRFNLISSDVMDDSVIPGGRPCRPVDHTLIRASRIAKDRWTSPTYSYYWPGVGSYSDIITYPDDIWVTPSNWQSTISSLNNEADGFDWSNLVVTLARQVKGIVESKSLLAVTLKELPATIRMVRNPFGLLRHDWRKIAKRSTAAELARKGANLWLEYTYGWKSAYYDIGNFAVSTAKYMVSTQRYRDRGLERYGKAALSSLQTPSPSMDDATWSYWKNQVENCAVISNNFPLRVVFDAPVVRYNVSCKASALLGEQILSLTRLISSYGLSADQIVENIWEVVPYSFVVDWFVNTKKIFNAFRLNDALKTLWSARVHELCYSMKIGCTYRAQALSNAIASSFNWWQVWSHLSKPQPSTVTLGEPGQIGHYVRQIGIPSGLGTGSFWSNQGLSVSQGVSGFSLLFQRLLRR